MRDEPATKKDIETLDAKIDGVESRLDAKIGIVANQVAVLTNDVAVMGARISGVEERLSGVEGRLSGMEERLVRRMDLSMSHMEDRLAKTIAQQANVISELVASKVTIIDEKYNHIPRKTDVLRQDFDEHCQDALAHRKSP